MESITLPEARIPVVAEADVVVVGGGPSGVAAAVRAARAGARTCLIDRFGSPGGMMTNGLMGVAIGGPLGGFHTELHERLRGRGYLVDLLERTPALASNPLFHYYGPNIMPGRVTSSRIHAFDPTMTALVMNELLEESGAHLLLRTQFVDAKVEGDSIRAVIVENASGRQAIGGRIFVDATGRGDVVARSGAPYRAPGNETGIPVAPGLMWKMAHVDFEKLFRYQKEDPLLDAPMRKARANGELPHFRPKNMDIYGGAYSGHPRPEMSPTPNPGEILLWAPAVLEWSLNGAESAEDMTRAEVEIRKHILAESRFLVTYVPGFEKAYVSAIAPFMGIREGRHPEGEYVMRYEDIRNERKFEDAALRRGTLDWFDTRQGNRFLSFDIPYRCFLAKRVINLVLAGDNLSMEHEAFLHIRGFGMALRTGEVAGTAAALAVKRSVTPRDLTWPGPL